MKLKTTILLLIITVCSIKMNAQNCKYDFDKEDPNLFESDLPPTTRFLVDQYGKSDDVSEGHRLVFIDIETQYQ